MEKPQIIGIIYPDFRIFDGQQISLSNRTGFRAGMQRPRSSRKLPKSLRLADLKCGSQEKLLFPFRSGRVKAQPVRNFYIFEGKEVFVTPPS